MAKNALLLELGPANIYLYPLPKAFLTMTSAPANSRIHFIARKGGAAGNTIRVAIVVAGINTPFSISVSGLDLTINLATNGAGTATTIASQAILFVTQDPAASFLVTAANFAGSDGTGLPAAQALTALGSGSDTGVKTDVGFVGDAVAYQVATEAAPLTGAQTGTVAQDKVVIGGMVKVVIPFKEISMDNFAFAVPSSRIVANSDGSKRRLDFAVAVGRSMRESALKMTINKIKGGFESTLPADIIVIPEISPAEGEVAFPFAPTTQREIASNWYAWPNGLTGRWAFTGDEFP